MVSTPIKQRLFSRTATSLPLSQSKGKIWLLAKFFFMHCLKSTFDKVMHVLKGYWGNSLTIEENLLRPGPKPKFTDLEVIALNITAECLSIDSENLLFHKLNSDYKNDFPYLISRRQYNDRRKNLFYIIEQLRKELSSKLNEINEIYAIDSMPLEICKVSRAERNKMGKEDPNIAPDKGFCASQSKYYYGYKLHPICSPSGVIQDVELTQASIHDIQYLKEVSWKFSHCIITGDRGYINNDTTDQLWKKSKICLEAPGRSNQKLKHKVMYELRRIRKRIETVFSQLCDQFMIQRNYAKSFSGFRTRIISKITAMTALQTINKFVNRTPVGKIKYSLL